jgi:post-segregation antitoxin (ccd killing protein)
MVITILTTIQLDDKIHALARKHGISLSGTARWAISARVEEAERQEIELLQKVRKEKKQYATLEPLTDLDGVIPDDCNDVIN